jgi:hypothetical protein
MLPELSSLSIIILPDRPLILPIEALSSSCGIERDGTTIAGMSAAWPVIFAEACSQE